jgi:hypothetical protein
MRCQHVDGAHKADEQNDEDDQNSENEIRAFARSMPGG